MNLNDCYNFEDFRKLAQKTYQLLYFIILMGEQMMKQLLKETQMLLMIVT